jgi:hypothetical protein
MRVRPSRGGRAGTTSPRAAAGGRSARTLMPRRAPLPGGGAVAQPPRHGRADAAPPCAHPGGGAAAPRHPRAGLAAAANRGAGLGRAARPRRFAAPCTTPHPNPTPPRPAPAAAILELPPPAPRAAANWQRVATHARPGVARVIAAHAAAPAAPAPGRKPSQTRSAARAADTPSARDDGSTASPEEAAKLFGTADAHSAPSLLEGCAAGAWAWAWAGAQEVGRSGRGSCCRRLIPTLSPRAPQRDASDGRRHRRARRACERAAALRARRARGGPRLRQGVAGWQELQDRLHHRGGREGELGVAAGAALAAEAPGRRAAAAPPH